MNQATISMITEWAHDRGVPGDLERMADELRAILLEGGGPVSVDAGGEVRTLPAPNLGSDTGAEHLPDAICLLLRRFLSPAREGNPELLAALLDLCCQMRPGGASEVVAGLLAGGAYSGLRGPDGPLEAQLQRALQACGLTEEGRTALRVALGDLDEAPSIPEPVPEPIPLEPAGAPRLPGDMIPQVNDPDQVFALLDAIGDGIADRRAYARVARVSVRQADFIARAAASLGLLDLHSGGEYSLTEAGKELPSSDDPAGREIRHRVVGQHPLLRDLRLERADTLPEIEELRQLLVRRTALGEGTIRRRAQALRRWVEWWASGGR